MEFSEVMHTVYLSRRNLVDLLEMLDEGEGVRECWPPRIRKYDTKHPKYPCTAPTRVVAVEDADYYGARGDR